MQILDRIANGANSKQGLVDTLSDIYQKVDIIFQQIEELSYNIKMVEDNISRQSLQMVEDYIAGNAIKELVEKDFEGFQNRIQAVSAEMKRVNELHGVISKFSHAFHEAINTYIPEEEIY